MKVMVLYESFFGNTEKVAESIADALRPGADVTKCRVNEFSPEGIKDYDCLIVGSPTRAFKPAEETMKFLSGIPRDGLSGIKVAAFDTRIAEEDVDSRFLRFMVRIFGYAAATIAAKLRKKGGEEVVAPEGFFVGGTEGPLSEGELERAAEWARKVLKG